MRVSINSLMDIIREKLDQNGEVVFTVSGNSMLPFFRNQETEVTLEKPDRPLRRGDIVLFKYQNHWILHRILKIKGETVKTGGDALTTVEMTSINDILAIVTKYQKGDRLIDVRKFSCRFRMRLWMFLRPIRKILMKIYHLTHKQEQ
ncbi:MAG: hypothetical protein GX661_06990 [Acholeplasmataceae bacterium]|nr:hypothetical protein [Acholeplasmataceae bacterium]